MRSLTALLLCLLLGAALPALPATERQLTQQEIDRAVENHRRTRTSPARRPCAGCPGIRTRTQPRKKSRWPDWLTWIGDLFGWMGEISQMLFWLVIAALVALLAVLMVRVFASGPGRDATKSFIAPTHVQDLDIRPESLPPDIGAVARALWDRGEQRAALALLYRGLLSRLAHVYEVPIRDSSTEGDCLTLAARSSKRAASSTPRAWYAPGSARSMVDSASRRQWCTSCARTSISISSARPKPARRAARRSPEPRHEGRGNSRGRRPGRGRAVSVDRQPHVVQGIKVPVPLQGEAARNPFYAAIRLSEELGAEATWERVFTQPPDNSVIFLSAWNWTLSKTRRERIERWVEAGGRLIVDDSVIGGFEEFERWSGVGEADEEIADEEEGRRRI